MISYVLIISGIVCIIISLIMINRQNNREKMYYENILKKCEDINEYYKVTSKANNEIYNLIEMIFEKMETNEDEIYKDYHNIDCFDKYAQSSNTNKENEDIQDSLITKVLNLKNMGYNNMEIAKKLNRGIREIDIILKMNEK